MKCIQILNCVPVQQHAFRKPGQCEIATPLIKVISSIINGFSSEIKVGYPTHLDPNITAFSKMLSFSRDPCELGRLGEF